jgi:hypothetical protein
MWLTLVAAITVAAPEGDSLDRTHLAIDGSDGTATLSIALSSRQLALHTASTTIDVPRGARVIGMHVTIGGVRADAKAMGADAASREFRRLTTLDIDPALLELSEAWGDFDRLMLHVFPVAKTSPARVVITMQLPPLEAIELDAPGHAIVELDGEQLETIHAELPARAWMSEDPAPRARVTALTSLFASEPAPATLATVPMVTIDKPQTACYFGVPNDVRKRIKLAHPALRHCYIKQAQRDPTLAGSVTMTFVIGLDGRARDISTAGTLANATVHACIAEQVASWTFARTDELRRINYPLQFRLAD